MWKPWRAHCEINTTVMHLHQWLQWRKHSDDFGRTYFNHGHSTTDEIAPILHKFWELESSGISVDHPVITLADQTTLEKVRSSLRFQNDCYQVGTPWKKEPPDLLNNHEMAVK